VDFIDIYWGQYHWPAFNVADTAISIGVGLFILDMTLKDRKTKKTIQ
jgi:signal peptidase II